jgi:hypothetical protein
MRLVTAIALAAGLFWAGPAAACTWPAPGEVLAGCRAECHRTLAAEPQKKACGRACRQAAGRYAAWAARPCDFLNQGACSADLEARGEKAGLPGQIAWGLVAKHGCLGEKD